MKKRNFLILVIAVFLLGSACATRRQVQELSLEVRAVRSELASIRTENAQLDSLFRSNIDQSRKLNADFSNYVARLDDRMQMIEARLEDAVTLINRATGAFESRSVVHSPGLADSDSTLTDTTRVSGKIDCQKIYNSAYYDFVKENYEMALSGFKNYLDDCPNTALADNAQYWIGECNYLQKKYELAQKAFEKMIKDYASSERLAAAKLKLGKALYNQRFKTKAKAFFKEIIENHPGTDEAFEAAQMLERYK